MKLVQKCVYIVYRIQYFAIKHVLARALAVYKLNNILWFLITKGKC